MKVRIGTRGSDLALWQADFIARKLSAAGVECEIVVLETRGDRIDDVPLTEVEGKSFFTAEIERALLDGSVDVAVHSHKDLATEAPPGLVIAAIPRRGPRGERLLISPAAYDVSAPFLPLALGARVGTSAPRRSEQLLALRPDLQVLSLRGNVPTRVKRLREGRYDAVVLAAAGIERLALDTRDLVDIALSEEHFVSAPAQGALAVQVRGADTHLLALLGTYVHDVETGNIVAAERRLLVRVGGGCNLPLGASIERDSSSGTFVAHAFLGAGQLVANAGPRWARAEAEDPNAAIDAVFAQLASGEPTACGPLAGLVVALTGSANEDTRLGARLVSLGALVMHEAVLAFEDVDAPDLGARVAAMQRGDALAVTSRQSARRLSGIRVPLGVTVAAVGSATARALESVGLRAEVVGSGGARELAEALPLLSTSRVLFPCAEDALGELEETLAARGVEVERVVLYRTLQRLDAARVEEADVRVYMSPSAVAASVAWEQMHPCAHTLRIALGRSTARALERAGLVPVEVEGAEGLMHLVARRFVHRG